MKVTRIESLSSDLGRFIRVEDKVIGSGGNKSHKQLLAELTRKRFGKPCEDDPGVVRERIIREVGGNVDMGFLSRETDRVVVMGYSHTYSMPEGAYLPEAREKSIEVLSKEYPDEKFVIRREL